jgi:hypothetical protein
LQEVVHTSSSTGAREQQRCSLVVAALDAITARADEDAVLVAAAQRRRTLLWTSNQTTLVTSFREVVSRGQLQTDTPNGAALAAAWARLQATGVLAIAGTRMLRQGRAWPRRGALQAPQRRPRRHAARVR